MLDARSPTVETIFHKCSPMMGKKYQVLNFAHQSAISITQKVTSPLSAITKLTLAHFFPWEKDMQRTVWVHFKRRMSPKSTYLRLNLLFCGPNRSLKWKFDEICSYDTNECKSETLLYFSFKESGGKGNHFNPNLNPNPQHRLTCPHGNSSLIAYLWIDEKFSNKIPR